MIKPPFIRVIAICIFRRNNRILVFEGFDAVKSSPYYRPLGGGIELGETSEAALIREIGEEIVGSLFYFSFSFKNVCTT